jgi:UDP-glucose-4-epimerase GalE
LLDAMHDAGIKDLVFSSTCATYGLPEAIPIGEDHPQHPVNPYGESKLFIERALRWYGDAYDLNWVALRYFNAAGADPDGEIGEDHDPETHLLPLAIDSALGRRPALEIYGSDYSTPDGTPVRDYIHVTDLARAHVLALQYLEAGEDSIALNLGTGKGHSVLEAKRIVEEVTGLEIPVHRRDRRPGDPECLVAEALKAEVVLGWVPEIPDLAAMVRTAWNWRSHQIGDSEPAGVKKQA